MYNKHRNTPEKVLVFVLYFLTWGCYFFELAWFIPVYFANIYHALLGLSGDVHFDDDEIYTVENDSDRSKRKLLWVSVHELGHSIGLKHSSLKGAVMYPWYQHFEGDDFDLTEDDILGLQQMYGMYFASVLRLSVDKSVLIRLDVIRTAFIYYSLFKVDNNKNRYKSCVLLKIAML